MEDIRFSNITTDHLSIPAFAEKNIEADVLRLDKMHPVISGNKWFKLRYYLDDAKYLRKKRIVTFGGAWSNHIIATAAACKLSGFKSTGIIRGEEPAVLSSTLKNAKELGMDLCFLSRGEYKKKKIPGKLVNDDCYFINEGGYGSKGADGAATILDFCLKSGYTHICCACGTGTMAAGLMKGKDSKTKIVVVSVLKKNFGAEENILSLLQNGETGLTIIHDYHFGGYAKYTDALLHFMNEFYRETSIPSDFVYSGKLFFGIHDLISKDYFQPGSRLLLIHCGGLQGNASLRNGTLIF
ncbi:MAG TPA: pyridoxal-phosphate dependent enzyme [Chitinophagaceae bacterium]|nr:pyridoxal-phosphate dependent enzyme [Chitinophagaceae bacterium]